MDKTLSQYSPYVIRTSTVLTNAYVAGTDIGPSSVGLNESIFVYDELQLLVDFTIGSLTSASIKIEFSDDGTIWFQEVVDSIGTPSASAVVVTENMATRTFLATGKYRISLAVNNKWIRVSSIGTGTVTNSLLAITAILGN